MDKDTYLQRRIKPYDPRAATTVEDALVALQRCSFQGRNLGRALEVLTNMVQKQGCLRVLTLSGAMIPAGMEEIVCQLVEAGVVNVIVSTGANISHSIVNVIDGEKHQAHFMGSPSADDVELNNYNINRIYDTYLPEQAYIEAERYLNAILARDLGRDAQVIMAPSEFLTWLGKRLPGNARSFVQVAATRDVPVFCPAISDSELGLVLLGFRMDGPVRLVLDELRDVRLFADVVRRHDRYGTIIVGGGVPRNWAQQVFPFLQNLVKKDKDVGNFPGYHYSVRFHTAVPQDGGLSGCTISESVSWGKYSHDAQHVSVWGDATISLPLVATALLQRLDRLRRGDGD